MCGVFLLVENLCDVFLHVETFMMLFLLVGSICDVFLHVENFVVFFLIEAWWKPCGAFCCCCWNYVVSFYWNLCDFFLLVETFVMFFSLLKPLWCYFSCWNLCSVFLAVETSVIFRWKPDAMAVASKRDFRSFRVIFNYRFMDAKPGENLIRVNYRFFNTGMIVNIWCSFWPHVHLP